MGLLFIFIDGLGIGPDVENNPLYQHEWAGFEGFSTGKLTSGGFNAATSATHLTRSIDANLDVEGLPQSGTGQASLFSGENASKLLGRHHGPYPHTQIKPLLAEPSIFGKALKLGYRCHFMNAYPERFFEYAEKHNRWSCTTKMCISNGIRLNRTEDVLENRAITAEIYQDFWQKHLGINLPDIDEYEAARRLQRAAEQNDLVIYEFYLTDKAGHDKSHESAMDALSRIDKLLQALPAEFDFDNHTLFITSDHGNIEDLSVKTHTRNPVPLMVYGPGAELFSRAGTLTDVTPAAISWLQQFRNPVHS